MFCANLGQYDPAADAVVMQVPLVLRDDTIRSILQHLHEGGQQISITVNVPSPPCAVEMHWDNEVCAFETRINGMSSGLVFFDELKGALGKPAPANYKTCAVCLCSELDIWRRGIIDIESGEVTAYTATPDLSYLGACAYLTDVQSLGGTAGLEERGIDALYLDLQLGDAATGVLRIGKAEASLLRNHLYEVEPDPQSEQMPQSLAMESLREIMDQVREMGEAVASAESNAPKGLR